MLENRTGFNLRLVYENDLCSDLFTRRCECGVSFAVRTPDRLIYAILSLLYYGVDTRRTAFVHGKQKSRVKSSERTSM